MTPGRLDAEILRRHLIALDAAVSGLRRHTGQPVEALRDNLDEAWAVERGFQLCTQNCLDIATHISAAAGHDVADYVSAIDRLAEIGIVPAGFVRRFRDIAGFRNILVLGYLDVDLDRLHRMLQERLSDFVRFASLVQAYLGRIQDDG